MNWGIYCSYGRYISRKFAYSTILPLFKINPFPSIRVTPPKFHSIPNKVQPPIKQQFSCNHPTQTSFLAKFTAAVPLQLQALWTQVSG